VIKEFILPFLQAGGRSAIQFSVDGDASGEASEEIKLISVVLLKLKEGTSSLDKAAMVTSIKKLGGKAKVSECCV